MSDVEYEREREGPLPYPQYNKPPPPHSSYRPDRYEPSTRRVDNIGLELSTQEDAMNDQEEFRYEVNEQPQYHVTRAIFLGNLRRPINAGHFQQYLKDLVSEIKDFNIRIERAWLNRPRTHGIVLVNSEEGAEYLRNRLSGSIYPSKEEDLKLKEEFENKEIERFEHEQKLYNEELEKMDENESKNLQPPTEPREFSVERIPLYADYIPVKAINQWTFEEDRGPRDGKWKLEFVTRGDELIASHTLLNGEFIPRYQPPPRNGFRGGRYSTRGGYSRGGYSRGGGGIGGARTDTYVPGASRDSRSTDSYVPSRRDRERSPSR
ncbi:uncharacterized protein KGF55_005742 [Candida pseudojiufengensis]|uniref:uncharacterized protein n=1 Tax=Candida pseudojiufengensis TaxID=497109 RepID=UPI0022241A2D|nr:uncharacterized protein KGF55_005742 [Candida pseudojiufengensis]KAI5958743.1 hypothetical protein KGF55_005742 [Candida pseudojiufengensis]